MNATVERIPRATSRLIDRVFPPRPVTEPNVRVGALAVVVAELGLLLMVMHLFRIEEDFGLLRLTPVLLVGFIVHALIPHRFRVAWFVLLSLSSILVVLGPLHGSGLIVLGLLLIGACHLPIRFAYRIAVVLAIAAAFAAIRGEWVSLPRWGLLGGLVLPVLGSMFMFRLAIYLYDLRHEREAISVWERLAYFFMLPNVCFLLFPVVDYKGFLRSHYHGNAIDIYQKGILWIARGVMHLVLYRVVYYHLLPSPTDVVDLGGVVQFMVTTYLLYLRISGQFHLIVGILCLFGFNLPETHHLYYLASSFNDYWRRINIYWKDFMMKLFYYPSLMRLRRWGMGTALVGSTIVVFIGTWLLHAYQWFWLQGVFHITTTDSLFWGVLGAFVVVNSLFEAKRTKRAARRSTGWNLKDGLRHSVQVLLMFVAITVLWSLWSSPTVNDWWVLLGQGGNSGVSAYLMLLLAAVLLVAVGTLIQYATSRGWSFSIVGARPTFRRSALATITLAGLLLVVGQPSVQARMGEEVAPYVASLQENKLNDIDAARMERGYYEGLLAADSYTSALALSRAETPEDWVPIQQSDLIRTVEGVLQYDLVPNYEGEYLRAAVKTNEWAMRDRSYALAKPPHVFRIALIGSSYEMGSGVANDQIYEALLEERLRHEHASENREFEVLNFAVNGYSALQYAVVADEKVFEFEPDALFVMGHSAEEKRLISHLSALVRGGASLPYEPVQDIIAAAGVTPDMSAIEVERRLKPHLFEIISWSYRHVARAAIERGVAPVWVFVPRTDEIHDVNEQRFVDQLIRTAEEAGFVTLSLADAFAGYTQVQLMVQPWDGHPSPLGHRLLAEELYTSLLAQERRIGLQLSRGISTSSSAR